MRWLLVFQKLREKKLGIMPVERFTSADSSSWMLCESAESECDPPLGQISFKDGRLHMVVKRWIETRTASEVITAFYGAIRDIEQRNLTQCQTAAHDDVSPGFEAKRVELVCGEHMIIGIALLHSAKTPPMVEVDQQLRADIPKTK